MGAYLCVLRIGQPSLVGNRMEPRSPASKASSLASVGSFKTIRAVVDYQTMTRRTLSSDLYVKAVSQLNAPRAKAVQTLVEKSEGRVEELRAALDRAQILARIAGRASEARNLPAEAAELLAEAERETKARRS